MKSEKNKTLRFSLIQAAYSIAGAGIIVTYIVPLYRSFGYDVTRIGILSAIAYLSAIIFEPVMGGICDRSKKTSPIITIAMIIGLAAFSIICFCNESMLCVAPAVILLYATTPSLAYLISQWSVKLRDSGIKINFGISRAMGSLAYGIFAAVFGKIIDIKGYDVIFPAFVVFSFITIILIVTVNETDASTESEEKKSGVTDLKNLLKSRKFTLLAISAMLSFVGSYCITVFLSIRVTELGAGMSYYGSIILIEGISEVVAILMYEKLSYRISGFNLMLLCFILSFISALIMSFAGDVRIISAGMVLHGIFTGLYVAGIANYIPEIIEKRYTYTAAMIVASCLSLAGALSSLYVGFVTKVISLQTAMCIATVMPALAVITFIVSKREVQHDS